MPTETLDLQRAVEQFLFREARLMDTNDYKGWLELWADEGMYWIPCNADDADPHHNVAIVYENRGQIEDRVWRLSGLHAHAQRPKSRLTRVVSNVEVEAGADGTVVAHSAFVLCEIRKNEAHFWAGRNMHVLERDGDDFRIVLKKVMLTNNDTVMPNMTFIV
ncbi:MAG: aromatic-ring-hydroxylating dioxygenase subunit beta [Candidatus Lustribacter sp.]|jgi:3-phenylpropionate/cinnamic acid dioxygenase small subunit